MTHFQPALWLYRLFWQVTDWVFPPECMGCGEPGFLLCAACESQIQYLERDLCSLCGYPRGGSRVCPGCGHLSPHFTEIRSLAVYSGCIRTAVQRLKYQNDLSIGALFTDALCGIVQSNSWKVDLIIPVPLSQERYASRGYNQAAVLARPMALQLDCAFDPKSLTRNRNTTSQVELDAETRRKNLEGVFSAGGHALEGKNILIVDDVITTGSTINECAKAVEEAGAKEVYGVSLGRSVMGDTSA